MTSFQRTRIDHIYREGNQSVDVMAKKRSGMATNLKLLNINSSGYFVIYDTCPEYMNSNLAKDTALLSRFQFSFMYSSFYKKMRYENMKNQL